MIVLITTSDHDYPLKSLVDGTYGVTTPKFVTAHYENLFRAQRVPRATYIFGDLERLAPWELRVAADRYRAMTSVGLRCLNHPGHAMARVELLTTLHKAGINPFTVYRADMAPRPARFPVFIRSEDDHTRAKLKLLFSQEELDRALGDWRASGLPLRGMLVIEQAAQPYTETLWAKWGTWRIGETVIVEHIAVDETWLVKTGDHSKVTETIAADEHDAVASNRFADDISKAFHFANIEFGRADHATVGGRTVVYEINTNPRSGPFVPDRNPLRHQTQLIARGRIADALAAIDTSETGSVPIPVRNYEDGGPPRRP